MIKKLSLCLILLSVGLTAWAQEQDAGFRGELGTLYRFSKKTSIEFTYRVDLIENFGQFNRSNFCFSYNKKLHKRLDIELYYRFITSYDGDKHRFRLALSTDKKFFKKTQLKFRTLLQHDVNYFDSDYLAAYKPNWVWRNKIALDRTINKKWSAAIYTEPFISQSYKGFHPYRLRSGLTTSYEKKKWKLTAEYFYQSEFYFEQSQFHNIGLGARYDITRIIRPKKKKGED